MPIRVGVVGAGQAGTQHAKAIAANRRAALAWVADPVRERGEALAAKTGAPYVREVGSALGHTDAVSICVPHNLLAENALAAAEAAVHILVEKPMAQDLDEAHRVVKRAKLANVVLMVGFVHRYRPEARRAKALIASGAIGEPCFLTDVGFGGGQAAWPMWVQRRNSGGGLLLYSGVHRFDRARWLLDREVVEVRGSTAALLPGSDVESSYSTLLTFDEGERAVLSHHYHAIEIPHAWETVVHGTDGMIHLKTGKGVDITSSRRTWHEDAGPDRHFEEEIVAFLDAIEGKRLEIPTGADGYAALEVAIGISRSNASGQPFRFDHGTR
jgi:myo-inositol 2-dehydrogenase/D-chiro-inositol 1-dehydrogenase